MAFDPEGPGVHATGTNSVVFNGHAGEPVFSPFGAPLVLDEEGGDVSENDGVSFRLLPAAVLVVVHHFVRVLTPAAVVRVVPLASATPGLRRCLGLKSAIWRARVVPHDGDSVVNGLVGTVMARQDATAVEIHERILSGDANHDRTFVNFHYDVCSSIRQLSIIRNSCDFVKAVSLASTSCVGYARRVGVVVSAYSAIFALVLPAVELKATDALHIAVVSCAVNQLLLRKRVDRTIFMNRDVGLERQVSRESVARAAGALLQNHVGLSGSYPVDAFTFGFQKCRVIVIKASLQLAPLLIGLVKLAKHLLEFLFGEV